MIIVRALIAAAALASLAMAQPAPPSSAATTQDASAVQIGAAGIGADLYLVIVRQDRTSIFERTPNRPFVARPALTGVAERFAATTNALYAFVGGDLYALRDERWAPELNLPGRATPLDVYGVGDDLYAIIASPPAGELPRAAGEEESATTQPFDAGAAPLSLVRYGTHGWVGLAGLPPAVQRMEDEHLGPRVGFAEDAIRLCWLAAAPQTLAVATLDAERMQWSVPARVTARGPLEGFWIASFAGSTAIIMATRAADGELKIDAARFVPGLEGDAAWRPATLNLSPLPKDRAIRACDTAFGFNQHVVLLAGDTSGDAILQFGRLDGPPAEPTVSIGEVVGERERELATVHWLQTLTVAILFAIVLSLFLFRRGALVQALILPRGTEVAFTFQRLLGLAVDLAPFVVVASLVVGIDTRAALRQITDWAVGLDPNRLPTMQTLGWWALATGACSAYMLVMELLTQRTMGKLLTGTRLLAETGVPADARQIVIRNLLRFLELQPPMWVLGFLVLLSRNRQRVGDIFARTVVVRRALVPPPPSAPPPTDQS